MIRINLLPVRQTQKHQTVQQQLLMSAGALVVTIIACVIWWVYMSSEAEDKRNQIVAKQEELKQLDKIIGEVNEFTTKKKELEEKLAVIEQLKKSKTGPVRALDALASSMPNRVWLTNLTEKGGGVAIEGIAMDHEDVSAFMKVLEKSKYFSGVTLGNSTAKQQKGGFVLYNFRITCRVNYAV